MKYKLGTFQINSLSTHHKQIKKLQRQQRVRNERNVQGANLACILTAQQIRKSLSMMLPRRSHTAEFLKAKLMMIFLMWLNDQIQSLIKSKMHS